MKRALMAALCFSFVTLGSEAIFKNKNRRWEVNWM